MYSMLPIGGSSSALTSVCQFSPATRVEFSSAWMRSSSGMVRMVALRQRVHVQGAEAPAERDLLLAAHLLVAKEDDLVLDQGAPDGGDLRCGKLLRKIDAEYLGA